MAGFYESIREFGRLSRRRVSGALLPLDEARFQQLLTFFETADGDAFPPDPLDIASAPAPTPTASAEPALPPSATPETGPAEDVEVDFDETSSTPRESAAVAAIAARGVASATVASAAEAAPLAVSTLPPAPELPPTFDVSMTEATPVTTPTRAPPPAPAEDVVSEEVQLADEQPPEPRVASGSELDGPVHEEADPVAVEETDAEIVLTERSETAGLAAETPGSDWVVAEAPEEPAPLTLPLAPTESLSGEERTPPLAAGEEPLVQDARAEDVDVAIDLGDDARAEPSSEHGSAGLASHDPVPSAAWLEPPESAHRADDSVEVTEDGPEPVAALEDETPIAIIDDPGTPDDAVPSVGPAPEMPGAEEPLPIIEEQAEESLPISVMDDAIVEDEPELESPSPSVDTGETVRLDASEFARLLAASRSPEPEPAPVLVPDPPGTDIVEFAPDAPADDEVSILSPIEAADPTPEPSSAEEPLADGSELLTPAVDETLPVAELAPLAAASSASDDDHSVTTLRPALAIPADAPLEPTGDDDEVLAFARGETPEPRPLPALSNGWANAWDPPAAGAGAGGWENEAAAPPPAWSASPAPATQEWGAVTADEWRGAPQEPWQAAPGAGGWSEVAAPEQDRGPITAPALPPGGWAAPAEDESPGWEGAATSASWTPTSATLREPEPIAEYAPSLSPADWDARTAPTVEMEAAPAWSAPAPQWAAPEAPVDGGIDQSTWATGAAEAAQWSDHTGTQPGWADSRNAGWQPPDNAVELAPEENPGEIQLVSSAAELIAEAAAKNQWDGAAGAQVAAWTDTQAPTEPALAPVPAWAQAVPLQAAPVSAPPPARSAPPPAALRPPAAAPWKPAAAPAPAWLEPVSAAMAAPSPITEPLGWGEAAAAWGAPAPLPPPETIVAGDHRIVLHTLEGSVKRGVASDIDLSAPMLALANVPGGAPAEVVPLARTKALFFMLAPGEKPVVPTGDLRRVKVTFVDGRQVEGLLGDEVAQGFFLLPVDARTNTARVFVLSHAVRTIV